MEKIRDPDMQLFCCWVVVEPGRAEKSNRSCLEIIAGLGPQRLEVHVLLIQGDNDRNVQCRDTHEIHGFLRWPLEREQMRQLRAL
jgi:hypothetical protein